MASVTAADIKKLRESTGAGMTDCKNALVEADGDFDKAVEQLRIKGLKGVAKREGRAASNGLVTAVLDGSTAGTMLELNCETDFVAKGEKFQALAAQVVEAAKGSNDLSSITVDGKPLQEVLERRRRHARREDRGAPRGHLRGRVRRPRTCTAPTPTCRRSSACSSSCPPRRADVAKDLAQHIAAFSPTYVSREEVSEEVVAKERSIAEATAREEGKPEAALPKIVEGRVNGFFKESVLLEQAFAKDPKKTVAKVLSEAGVEVKGFARFKVGQA